MVLIFIHDYVRDANVLGKLPNHVYNTSLIRSE